jgi:hypothetical protein
VSKSVYLRQVVVENSHHFIADPAEQESGGADRRAVELHPTKSSGFQRRTVSSTIHCAKATRPQKSVGVGLSHGRRAFRRIPACAVLLRRQNVGPLVSGGT